MLLKNNKGMALPLVIIIMAFLLILGNSMLSTEIAEVYMNIHDENETQAYYIARSVAEAILADLSVHPTNINNLLSTAQADTGISFAGGTARYYIEDFGVNVDGLCYYTLSVVGEKNGVQDEIIVDMIQRPDDDTNFEVFNNVISALGSIGTNVVNISNGDGTIEKSFAVDYSGDVKIYEDKTGNNQDINPGGEPIWIDVNDNSKPYEKLVIADNHIDEVLRIYGMNADTFYEVIYDVKNSNSDNMVEVEDFDDNSYYYTDDPLTLYSYYEYDENGDIIKMRSDITNEDTTNTLILVYPPPQPEYYEYVGPGNGSYTYDDVNEEYVSVGTGNGDYAQYEGYPEANIPDVSDTYSNFDFVSNAVNQELKDAGILDATSATTTIISDVYFKSMDINSTLKLYVPEDSFLVVKTDWAEINADIEIIGDTGTISDAGTVYFIIGDYMEIKTNINLNYLNDSTYQGKHLLIIFEEDMDADIDLLIQTGQVFMDGFIYGPSIEVNLLAGLEIKGAFICENLVGNGNATVIFDPEFESLQTQFVISLGSYKIVPIEYR